MDCLCTVLVVGIVEYSSNKLYIVFQHFSVVFSSDILSNGALVIINESFGSCTGDSPILEYPVIPANRLFGLNF